MLSWEGGCLARGAGLTEDTGKACSIHAHEDLFYSLMLSSKMYYYVKVIKPSSIGFVYVADHKRVQCQV